MTVEPTSASPESLLVEAVQSLSQARSVTAVAEIVRHAARQLASADGATFVLRDGDLCYYLDEEAIAPLWKGLRFPMQACISGWSMIHGESVAIPDIYADSRIPIAAYKPTFVKSLLMTPIRQKNAIGAIGVYWARRHEPSPKEIELLKALANSTSVAMENVKLNEDLEAKVRELERASKDKDHFLMVLSHELRTPMNSILGWSEILQEDSGGLKPHFREGLASIHRNAEAEMHLISDLLDTSQILAGRLALEKRRVSLRDVVEASVKAARLSALQKSIELKVPALLPEARVEGDPERLRQIADNLLSNAIKFTPENGRILLKLEEADGGVLLTVEDNGEGISADELPRIFDRFHPQSSESTRRHGGLGLGLAITRHLVEAYGGRVTAVSAGPQRGSRFEAWFPEPAAAETRAPVRREPVLEIQKQRRLQ